MLSLPAMIVACGASQSPSTRSETARLDYRVILDPDLGGVRVRVCARGFSTSAFVSMSGQGRAVPDPSDSCAGYDVRFPDGRWFSRRAAGLVVSAHEDWLWRPDPLPSVMSASVRFELPDDATVASPWPRRGDQFSVDRAAFRKGAFHVFGVMQRTVLPIGGSEIEIVAPKDAIPADTLTRWIGSAAQAVASLGERFPRERILVIALPVEGNETVVFGLIRRGGGVSVLLLPSTDASAEELEQDWVAVHEFSHLWLPVLRDDAAWIGEGIATYLQEVLRARCGLQSSQKAWQRMLAGFERGRRAGTGRTLLKEARLMHRTGAYHHVYWSGAAFALEADTTLRIESGGAMSLEKAIMRALPAWSSDGPSPTATAALKTLSDAAAMPSLAALGERYAAAKTFPSWPSEQMAVFKETFLRVARPLPGGCAN